MGAPNTTMAKGHLAQLNLSQDKIVQPRPSNRPTNIETAIPVSDSALLNKATVVGNGKIK